MSQKPPCKEKQKSTQLNDVLNSLIQQGQELFHAALEQAKEHLPPEDEIVQLLKGLADKLALVMQELAKALNKLSAEAVDAVREFTQNSSKVLDDQSKELKDEEGFKNAQVAVMKIKDVMERALKELQSMMEKMRPHADATSQKLKEVLNEKINKMNELGEELKGEVQKALGSKS